MKKAIAIVLLLSALLWLGVPSAKEAMRTYDGIRCHENMVYIEKGKAAYIQTLTKSMGANPVMPRNPDRYIELIPYMPLKNIPECPSGKPYLGVLDLNTRVSCQINGQADYEPTTPGVNPAYNGYHDQYNVAKALGWWEVPLQMLGIRSKSQAAAGPFQP
jgi:hypothetical protein